LWKLAPYVGVPAVPEDERRRCSALFPSPLVGEGGADAVRDG
jgi:hypothetical protein